MRPADALQQAQQAMNDERSELEKRWVEQCFQLVGEAASRGAMETEVRILAPHTMPPGDALISGRWLQASLERAGFRRPRVRVRDDFLDAGPAIVGDVVYPEGSLLIWLEVSLDWDR